MKLFREPLLHFLIAGGLLFGGFHWWERGAPISAAEEPIRIGDGELQWLRETFTNQWQRRPTPAEMKDLVGRLVEEELLAREARALGLDKNDTIIRRRLAQKLTFLIEDTSHFADPGEDELRRFHAAHAEHYRKQARVSFSQVFFSPTRRPQALADAQAALALISVRGAGPPEGDPLLVEDSYADVDESAVARVFGGDFARTVFALTPGQWSGPVRSAFGVHLVQVTSLRAAELRRFEEVRDTAADDWRRQRAAQIKAEYLARLQKKYGVATEGGEPLLARDRPGQVLP